MKDSLEELAGQFRQWYGHRRGHSPAYEAIIRELIEDEDLLGLVAEAGDRDYVHYLFGDSPRIRSPFSFGTDRDSPLKSITVLLGTRSVFSRQSDHFSRPRPTVIDNGRILIGMGGD
jgi:hypothetical protein